MLVETGDRNSVSWQFAVELSKLWNQKNPDKNTTFSPKYVPDISQRFMDLDKQNCKLIIAPLKTITELSASNAKVKIAVVLWESYLAAFALDQETKKVGLNTHDSWYLPKQSLIIPTLLNSMNLFNRDQTSDENAINTQVDAGHIKNQATDSELPVPVFKGEVIWIEKSFLPDITAYYYEGILFYEMLGPASELTAILDQNLKMVGLDRDFIELLQNYNPMLNPFRLSKRKINTVGLIYALFVNELEDAEFMRELFDVLYRPPKTIFSKSYIMDHLELGKTKKVSPLFLHETSITYFNID